MVPDFTEGNVDARDFSIRSTSSANARVSSNHAFSGIPTVVGRFEVFTEPAVARNGRRDVPSGDTLTLPANAVHYDELGNSHVYVVSTSNQVVIAEVQTGLDNGEFIEIIAGLNGNERVVGPLLRRLKPGQTVIVN